MSRHVPCYPLKFEPVIMSRVWGARRMGKLLNKKLPGTTPIGESWEVSDHAHGMSVVTNGPLKGKTFRQLLQADPFGMAGPDGLTAEGHFVLLFKFLDADGYTSVQVHPDDVYARQHEKDKSGKSEAWYILHAEPGAKLVRGTLAGVDRLAFEQALKRKHVEQTLDFFAVHTGDVISLPAGVLHALGPGITLAEIQQNCDNTYRVFDWNRKGLNGKPRELHMKKALDVLRFDDIGPNKHPKKTVSPADPLQENLIRCDMFAMDRLVLAKPFVLQDRHGRFDIITAISGRGRLEWSGGTESFKTGDSFFLPAGLDTTTIEVDGNIELLWIRRP